jgi:hypothetical protein
MNASPKTIPTLTPPQSRLPLGAVEFFAWDLGLQSHPTRKAGHTWVRPARMHPQSEDGPVLGLHSCSALSPGPRAYCARRRRGCHGQP